jgi:hypothetical protein
MSRSRKPVALVTVALGLTLAISACVPFPHAVTESAVPTVAAPSEAPTATPTLEAPTPTPTPTVAAPLLTAGMVADGTSQTVKGTGSAVVGYTREGAIAVVVGIDCSSCTGLVNVTSPERMSPLGEATAPMEGSYLVDVSTDSTDDPSIVVTAEGDWTLTLTSWNDLDQVSGKQSGTGSTVLYFSDTASKVTVTYEPLDATDSFGARIFTESDTPFVFGNDEAFTETEDTDLPGVIAISTNGAWSVTPLD